MAKSKVKAEPETPVKQEKPKEVKKLVWAELPLVSVLPRKLMDEAKDLLEELDSIRQLKETYASREDELKRRLEDIQSEHELCGLRYGQLAYCARSNEGRRTLNKIKLIELGVSAQVVEAAYKRGDPYIKREFRNLSKPAQSHSEED